MVGTDAQHTFRRIQSDWRSMPVEGRWAMIGQLEQLAVREETPFLTQMLQGEIRELVETIRVDIDRQATAARTVDTTRDRTG